MLGSTVLSHAPALRRAEFLLASVIVALALIASPRAAHAFSEPRSYFDDPAVGGGGGRWFTGSPAEGFGCSVCHTGGSAKLQIVGLPIAGYAPGNTYDITVSWPEFAARYRELNLAPVPGVAEPSMGLVGEFVSESGLGAGRLEVLATNVAAPTDLCTLPPGAAAAQLYSVRPGEPTEERMLSCDAGALGQRCLVAVVACGAEQLHLRWTPPAAPIGPIWFAAGFVTTEAISGTPQGDAIKEYARAMLPLGSSAERYESELDGGCSVSRAHARGAGFDLRCCGNAFLLIALVVARRVRRRSVARGEPG